ncbi:MAG: hypothetical protein ACRDHD_07185, partial [Candidatus Limnocylindria bacterium]
MALVKITPTPAHVQWDRRQSLPVQVRIGDRQLMVTSVDAVRDETAAFPAHAGPRVTFLVATDAGQASLV